MILTSILTIWWFIPLFFNDFWKWKIYIKVSTLVGWEVKFVITRCDAVYFKVVYNQLWWLFCILWLFSSLKRQKITTSARGEYHIQIVRLGNEFCFSCNMWFSGQSTTYEWGCHTNEYYTRIHDSREYIPTHIIGHYNPSVRITA